MRILITNNTLGARAGTELYVRDLATALVRRGHHPIAYSQELGEVAEELRAAGVPVVNDLAQIAEPPEVIHGHHHLETMTALNWFPEVSAIFVCHGWLPWQEAPPVHPGILRYVAVDELCRQRLLEESAIDPGSIEVILNSVDLDRFRPRQPLPDVPRRALVYSNQASAGEPAEEVEMACSLKGIHLDVVGQASGNPTTVPETLLPQYDLVFAKARAALEAMAVGCAVVLCDTAGVGPMVAPGNFGELRPLNFGLKTLSQPMSADVLAAQVARYDRDDATAVRDRVRREANLSDVVDRFLVLYREIAGYRAAPPEDEGRANAVYLRALAPRIKQNDEFHVRLADAAEETRQWRHGNERLGESVQWLEACRSRLEERNAGLESEAHALREELDRAYGTVTWRLRERVLRWRFGRFARRLFRPR